MTYKSKWLVPLPMMILLIALPQMSETIYAVSLPQIAFNLKTNQALVEYTITSNLIGFALGILLWGNLSDKIGRRPCLFLGLSIYVLASFLCWLSNSIEYLIVVRFVQGIGISVGSVLGQAIARDVIAPQDRVGAFSIINIAVSFAPAIGMVVGNIITQNFYWSTVFVVLIIFAIILMVSIFLFVPESNLNLNKNSNRHLFGKCLSQVIYDHKGLRLGFFIGAVMGILFGYFAESAFYFIEILAISSVNYGLLAFLIFIPLVCGSIISRVIKYTPDQIIELGITVLFLGSICFFILVKLGIIISNGGMASTLLSIICIYIVLCGVSIIIPNCLNQILIDYGEYTGTAASIFGFYYYIITAAITVLMAILHDGTINALPIFFVIVSGIMLILSKRNQLFFKSQFIMDEQY